MNARRGRRQKLGLRVLAAAERAILGGAMWIVAVVLERKVIRSLKRARLHPPVTT